MFLSLHMIGSHEAFLLGLQPIEIPKKENGAEVIEDEKNPTMP